MQVSQPNAQLRFVFIEGAQTICMHVCIALFQMNCNIHNQDLQLWANGSIMHDVTMCVYTEKFTHCSKGPSKNKCIATWSKWYIHRHISLHFTLLIPFYLLWAELDETIETIPDSLHWFLRSKKNTKLHTKVVYTCLNAHLSKTIIRKYMLEWPWVILVRVPATTFTH